MKDFSKVLGKWYLNNKRDLPWRNTKNPYFIWLSEIILQQTRVEQGLPYYEKFIENFPTLEELAKAPQEKVLRLWQGLGYYSRARNLHSAAKQVLESLDGKFPKNHEEILSLIGVGEYTAAAIASFAYNLPHAVVDGNVYRFLSRYFGIFTPIDSSTGKKEFSVLAEKLLDRKNPAIHNQAIMEMGAMVCKPVNPSCQVCPFISGCEAYNKGIITQLPVKSKKLKVKIRYFNYLLIHDGNSVLIGERGAKDIWQGLFEFPLIESKHRVSIEEIIESTLYKELIEKKALHESTSLEVKHLLSHQTLLTRFWWFRMRKLPTLKKLKHYRIVEFDDLNHFGMPQLIVKYLKGSLNK